MKATEFSAKFSPLQATILDPNGMFSGSGMVASLQALEPLARELGEYSPELAHLYNMLSLVQSKRGYQQDQVDYGEKCLAIHRIAPVLTAEELFRLHYQLGAAAGEIGDANRAVQHFQASVRMMPSLSEFDASQWFGLRQDLGYWLHEARDYPSALATNQSLLADAEKEFGADNQDLTGVLTNLAQNHYELGNMSAARDYLLRCLSVAREHHKVEIEFDMMFQLGVLAHEIGDAATALDFFSQGVALADRENDDDLREQAQATLEQHRSRMQLAPRPN